MINSKRLGACRAVALVGAVFLFLSPISITAFAHKPLSFAKKSLNHALLSSTALSSTTTGSILTTPIPGMKPGTSGLRKKVEVWQGQSEDTKNYVENFIQSLLNVAKEKNGNKMLDTCVF